MSWTSLDKARQAKNGKRLKNKHQTQNARNTLNNAAKNASNCHDTLEYARMKRQIADMHIKLQSQKQKYDKLNTKFEQFKEQSKGKLKLTLDNCINYVNNTMNQLLSNVNEYSQSMINKFWGLFKRLNKMLYVVGKVPATPWQIRKEERGIKAQQKSITWLLSCIEWHCMNNDDIFEQLIGSLIKKCGKILTKQIGLYQVTLNDEQTNEIQQKVNLTRSQMRVLRRILRHYSGYRVLTSESIVCNFQDLFRLFTGAVYKLGLQYTETAKSKNNLNMYHDVCVYHASIIEAAQRLLENAFKTHRFYIEKPLLAHEFILQIGWDKSKGGFTSSTCLNITSQYHGKYCSIATILTNDKVDENYSNYRELSQNWNLKQLTDGLLRFPNMIIVAQICQEDGEIKSKLVSSFIMWFDDDSQKMWDHEQHDTLIDTPAPRSEKLHIQSSDITNAIQEPDSSRTNSFWYEKSKIAQIKPMYVVKLPEQSRKLI